MGKVRRAAASTRSGASAVRADLAIRQNDASRGFRRDGHFRMFCRRAGYFSLLWTVLKRFVSCRELFRESLRTLKMSRAVWEASRVSGIHCVWTCAPSLGSRSSFSSPAPARREQAVEDLVDARGVPDAVHVVPGLGVDQNALRDVVVGHREGLVPRPVRRTKRCFPRVANECKSGSARRNKRIVR